MKQRILSKKNIIIYIIVIGIIFGIFVIFKPLIIEVYCEKQAKEIVGNQWGKLFDAVGYERDYVSQITWGFREQLRCERAFK